MADFGRELMRRRVPQIVGAYLAGGWILLEFTDWAVNRYVLSSHVTDFVVASWLLLLPAVAMLAWNHGSPGRDRWSLSDTISVSLNLVLAGAILFSLFRGQSLGAATSTVVVQDEEGTELIRQVPRPEFRHQISLFSLANESGDAGLDWLQYALPKAIAIDLTQEPFVRAVADSWYEREGGTPENPLILPLARRREIAGKEGSEAFVTGTITRVDQGLELRLVLMDSERGRTLAEHIFVDESPLDLADRASIQLRRDLGIPTGHLDSTPDLPVVEMLASAEEALRPFFAGTFYHGLDAGRSRAGLEAAVAGDSTFARASAILGDLLFSANDMDGAIDAYEAAIRHEYRLEESSRFALKTQYFYASQQPERALQVARLRTELFPYDPAAFQKLAHLLARRGEVEAAIVAYESSLSLEPTNRRALLEIGDLHRDEGDFQRAADAYGRLEALDSRAVMPHLRLGELAVAQGNLNEARAEYERARILDPSVIPPTLGLAEVGMLSGDFPAADAHLADAAEQADADYERVQVLTARARYLELRGRPAAAAQAARAGAAIQGRSGGRLQELQSLGQVAVLHARAGDSISAFELLDTLRAELLPPLDGLVSLFEAQVQREQGAADRLSPRIAGVKNLIESFGLGSAEWLGQLLEGEVFRLSGDCESAVPLYRSAAESMQAGNLSHIIREFGTDPLTAQATCLRTLGRNEEAESAVRAVLQLIPAEPTALLELARIEADRGRPTEALRAVDAALIAWSEADSGYRPAMEARALRDRISD